MKSVIGAGIIVLACYAAGSAAATGELQSQAQLCGLIRLLEYLKIRISFTRDTLPDIYAGFSDTALDGCGFTEELRKRGLSSALSTLSIDREAASAAAEFAMTLGRLDSQSQGAKLDAAAELLRARRDAVSGTVADRCRSIKALSALAGAMIAILLL